MTITRGLECRFPVVFNGSVAVQLRAIDASESRSTDEVEDSVCIADRYELLACAGRGASGTVYKAYDRTLDRFVALKLLEPGVLAEAEREAQVLARISHRNVVTIHDFGRSNGRRYLVLELLEGQLLGSWLGHEAREPAAVLAQFLAAGRGLIAAHEAGLVHRDFKPNNVLVTTRGRVVVVDFGLAHHAAADRAARVLRVRPRSSLTQGTLAYMAPEQLDGAPADARSDQFAFCVALWEALAGQSPFGGDDPPARYEAIRRGPALRSSLPPGHRSLARILARGMAFDPELRFGSMTELLAAIEQRPTLARGLRPAFIALTALATFLVGWGIAPTELTTGADDSASVFDPRADTAASLVESARDHADMGETQLARADLEVARVLLAPLGPQDPAYCQLGASFPGVAASLADLGDPAAARTAYALALRFAQDCDDLDVSALLAAREASGASPSPSPQR